jgi:hypothetical protein
VLSDKIGNFINVQTNTFAQRWKISGFQIRAIIKSTFKSLIKILELSSTVFDERYNLKSSFDSIRLNIENIDKSGGKLHIDGYTSITNFRINHPKIASKDVVIKMRFDYRFLLGSDFISVDSSSTVNSINYIPTSPMTESDTIYKLKIVIPKMKAQDFITSLS